MTAVGVAQITVFLVILTVAARFFGNYMAWVYFSSGPRSTRVLGTGERGLLRLLRITKDHEEQTWQGYSISVVAVSLIFVVVLYLQLRIQNHLPLNPDGMSSVNAGLAFNTATSFLTNTNWQYYVGESTMSYLSQMAGLAVQNFVSAAVGMAVLAGGHPGILETAAADAGELLGRSVPLAGFILLPIAVVGAIVLVSQGVSGHFSGHAVAHTLQGGTQDIARGPVASQISIKHLGTNGGGFFNANSAAPSRAPRVSPGT